MHFPVPRFLALTGFLLAARLTAAAAPAPAAPLPELPPLLKEAFANSSFDENHWAYTQTKAGDVKVGKETKRVLTIVRFDPSKPYAEQYTPQLVEGHSPTAADLKEYRKKGEARADALEKQEKEKQRAAGKGGDKRDDRMAELGQIVDIGRIAVLAETATEVSYAFPIRKDTKILGSKLDRLELIVRVSKADHIVSGLSVRLLDSIRVMLIANVKAGDFAAEFGKPDPAHGAVMTRLKVNLDASMFFKKISAKEESTRADFSWVTPYDERFKTEIGPLKVIGF